MTSTNFTLWSQFVEKTASCQLPSTFLPKWLLMHQKIGSLNTAEEEEEDLEAATNLGVSREELGSVAIMTFQEARNVAVEEAVVIEVQRTFEGQKRAQIGPEGRALKMQVFMEMLASLFRKATGLYILKVVYSQSLTAIGDGLWFPWEEGPTGWLQYIKVGQPTRAFFQFRIHTSIYAAELTVAYNIKCFLSLKRNACSA